MIIHCKEIPKQMFLMKQSFIKPKSRVKLTNSENKQLVKKKKFNWVLLWNKLFNNINLLGLNFRTSNLINYKVKTLCIKKTKQAVLPLRRLPVLS